MESAKKEIQEVWVLSRLVTHTANYQAALLGYHPFTKELLHHYGPFFSLGEVKEFADQNQIVLPKGILPKSTSQES